MKGAKVIHPGQVMRCCGKLARGVTQGSHLSARNLATPRNIDLPSLLCGTARAPQPTRPGPTQDD